MFRIWVLLVTSVLIIVPLNVSSAEVLEIPGTGSCQNILEKLAQAFNQKQSDVTIKVPDSIGSSGGIREALAGRAEIARVARQLKREEVEGGLSEVAFAKDLLIFVVGERVNIKQLTKEQLEAIYTGRKTNWSEVGGQDMPIRVLSRQPGDTNLSIAQDHLKGFGDKELTKRAKILYTDQEMVDMIKKYPSAIGFGTRSEMMLSGLDIALTIGDMNPTLEAAASGKYPLTGTYYLIFKEDRITTKGRQFLSFVLSEEGFEIITKFGLVPLSR